MIYRTLLESNRVFYSSKVVHYKVNGEAFPNDEIGKGEREKESHAKGKETKRRGTSSVVGKLLML